MWRVIVVHHGNDGSENALSGDKVFMIKMFAVETFVQIFILHRDYTAVLMIIA